MGNPGSNGNPEFRRGENDAQSVSVRKFSGTLLVPSLFGSLHYSLSRPRRMPKKRGADGMYPAAAGWSSWRMQSSSPRAGWTSGRAKCPSSPAPDSAGLLATGGIISGSRVKSRGDGSRRIPSDTIISPSKGNPLPGPVVDAINPTVSVDGTGSMWVLMANAWYDFDTGTNWTPYIGGGLGMLNVDFEVEVALTIPPPSSSDQSAYQPRHGRRRTMIGCSPGKSARASDTA